MSIVLPRVIVLGLIGIATFLGGCTTLSGVGGDTQYACPAPRGVQCGSVTANYLQSLHRDLPGQSSTKRAGPAAETTNATNAMSAPLGNAEAGSATPLHSPPRILKLWVAPWEDRDGVLHDAAFVFVPIDHGHWLLDDARPATRRSDSLVQPSRSSVVVAPTSAGLIDAARTPARLSSPAANGDDDAQ